MLIFNKYRVGGEGEYISCMPAYFLGNYSKYLTGLQKIFNCLSPRDRSNGCRQIHMKHLIQPRMRERSWERVPKQEIGLLAHNHRLFFLLQVKLKRYTKISMLTLCLANSQSEHLNLLRNDKRQRTLLS